MKRLLRSWSRDLAGAARVFAARRTDPADVAGLIAELRPVPCGREPIRLGPPGDGGYLVPDDLAGIGGCFSPGVDRECRFELDCAARGMRVFMADASVAGPPVADPAFAFLPRYLGAVGDGITLTLDEWVAGSGASPGDLLLQMDIEGHEYATLLAASPALLERFRILVIEFHDLVQLFNRPFFALARAAFRKLLCHHACVHLHPNNCCGQETIAGIAIPRVMEFTFLRRDRIAAGGAAWGSPHVLDRDNTARPALPLPRVWHPSG